MEDLFATNPRNLKLPTTGLALLPVSPSTAHNLRRSAIEQLPRMGLLNRSQISVESFPKVCVVSASSILPNSFSRAAPSIGEASATAAERDPG
jgi:hypothetical protein